MNFPFFIAKRYLFSKKSHNAINVLSAISVCGVALATLAMVCTLSVFNGFQDMVATFFTAFDPQIKITSVKGKVFDGSEPVFAEIRTMPEVAVYSESVEDNAMVQYKGRQAMAVIKGVEDAGADGISIFAADGSVNVIAGGAIEAAVYDVSGKLVGMESGSDNVSVNVDGNGLYIVKAVADGKSVVRKVVVR